VLWNFEGGEIRGELIYSVRTLCKAEVSKENVLVQVIAREGRVCFERRQGRERDFVLCSGPGFDVL
jgi:hypothetical protein